MSSHPNILVVSDAASSAQLCAYLRGFRFEVTALTSSAELLAQLARERFDLVVLDLKLPGSGLGLLRALRAASATAIIVLGDLASATDRVVGLEMGADDCLDQPFVNRELVARIQTVLRRTRGASMQAMPAGMQTDLIRFDGWELQRSERKLRSPAGQPVSLSNAEFRLLDTFLKAPRRVVSRDQLAEPGARLRHRRLRAKHRSAGLAPAPKARGAERRQHLDLHGAGAGLPLRCALGRRRR